MDKILLAHGSGGTAMHKLIREYFVPEFDMKSLGDSAIVDLPDSPIHPFTHPPIHVLFSAHSLPEKFIDEGDPYVRHIERTIEEIVKRIPIKWNLSFQSRSGPVKWLRPSTEETLKELAGRNIKNILMVPISFVSDHIETLYEIDILYMQMAKGLGINLKRTESLNTHPLFIEALKDIVIKNVKELGWIE